MGYTYYEQFQALVAKLQELGLKKLYSQLQHSEFTKTVKGCMSLPFIPLSKLDEAFKYVKTYAQAVHPNIFDRTEEFVQYVESTWLRGNYSPLTWNFFASYLQKTNNVSEGYNHAFNSCREFGGVKHDPNVFLLIQIMKKELVRTQDRAMQFEIGQDPRPRKQSFAKQSQKQTQRHELMQKLSQGKLQLKEYMDAVGRSSLLTHFERPDYDKDPLEEESDEDFEDSTNTPDNYSTGKTSNGSTGKKSTGSTSKKSTGSTGKKSTASTGKTSNVSTGKKSNASTGHTSDKQSAGKSSRNSDNKISGSGTQPGTSNSTDQKSDKEKSSGKKPGPLDLFSPSPGRRTPRKLYLTGESKGSGNYGHITFLLH